MKRLAIVLCLAAIAGHLAVARAEVEEACIPSDGAQVSAGNFLTIESKTVGKGKPITVGLSVTNDVTLKYLIIPLIIRSVDSGAFITTMLPQRTPGGRLESCLKDYVTLFTYPNEDGHCKGSEPGGFFTPYYSLPEDYSDGISPEGLKIVMGGFGPYLEPGTDGTTPSIQILLTTNNTVGRFEIDSSCCDPGCHLVFGTRGGDILPTFTKGVITIVDCGCPNQGDINGDGVLDLFDVLAILEYQFSGGPPPPIDPGCPAADRGDVNCDGDSFRLFDAIYLIEHIFVNGPPPCNPCDCVAYPTDCP